MTEKEREVRFNEALDTDRDLQDGMEALVKQLSGMTEAACIDKTLLLFRRVGLALTRAELKRYLARRLQREADRLGQMNRNEVKPWPKKKIKALR